MATLRGSAAALDTSPLNDAAGFALRYGPLSRFPQGASTLGCDARRFPRTPPACYRPAWSLRGPDSHRLATTGLSLSVQPLGLTSNLLGTRMIGANVPSGSGLTTPVPRVEKCLAVQRRLVEPFPGDFGLDVEASRAARAVKGRLRS